MSIADALLQKLHDHGVEGKITREEMANIVADAIRAVGEKSLAKMSDAALFGEVEALSSYIKNARQEIANLNATNINSQHIPSATDELDAVVGATEDATNKIMNCCDEIMAVSGKLEGEVSSELGNIVTNIYEACNFQDITGQRITKVVRTLKYIETHLADLMSKFGTGDMAPTVTPDANFGAGASAKAEEKSLLNGPQSASAASSQDEIDQLLASFDAP